VNCSKCKAAWTPPVGRTITNCPFCGEALAATMFTSKESALHEMLRSIVQQFGREILGETRLRGLISDLMPNSEKKYLRILKQAVDDGVGTKLLEMESDTFAVRTMKISSLKETFKNNNGFSNSADYVVECFLFALGLVKNILKEKESIKPINKREIIKQTIEIAFSNNKLTKEEAGSLFNVAKTIDYPAMLVQAMIKVKIEELNLFPDVPYQYDEKYDRESINSRNWISFDTYEFGSKNYESIKVGNRVWMNRNLDVSHFRNGETIPEAKTIEEWKKAGKKGEPAWCYYKNDPKKGRMYGKLYNWFAFNDPRNIAPKGWRIPSFEELDVLIFNLADKDLAISNIFFSGIPCGYRSSNFDFVSYGYTEYLWSSAEYNSTHAHCRSPYRWIDSVYSIIESKDYGFSVRCLRDADY